MREILVNIDLNGNQLLGLRLEVLAADPTGGNLYQGRLWYNSGSNQIKYYDGSTVQALGTGSGGVQSLTVDNATIENIGTATNPSIRVKAAGITDTHITGPIAFSKLGAPAASFSMNNQKIINLLDPTAAQDAATKAYVDAAAAGIDWKASVRAATTANITLSAPQTIDGVSVIAGDRVLVKNQTTGANNGLYVVAAGAWTRATDADVSAEVSAGLAVFVSEGTLNGNTSWILTTDDPITLGTTALVFTQFSGPGSYTAGTGLTLTGTQFSLTTPVSVANGGTGGTDAATARTNLGTPGRFAQAVGDGSSTSIAVTHNLGTRDVIVEVYDAATFDTVLCDTVRTSTTVVTLGFAVAPASNSLRVVVIG